jgi:uncharacterized SAM-binding protein YcdF (DUF218 family)
LIAFLKSVAGVLAAPLAFAIFLAIVALIPKFLGRRRLAAGLVMCAITVAVAGSIPLVGDAILRPLEGRYAPLDERALKADEVSGIVVLGAYYRPWRDWPVTAVLNREGLMRIAEGVRLARRFPSAKLIVSGGFSPGGGEPSARGYERFALEMGIPAERIVVVDTPRDTAQEALAISAIAARLAPDRKFVLVTSASHMPRAMKLMERAGARPLPAPTGQRAGWGDWVFGRIVPSSGGLEKTEIALHEYAGLTAMALGLD